MNGSEPGYRSDGARKEPHAPGISELTQSRSMKWSTYPDKLGLWVAESDFGLAPVVAESLQTALSDELTAYLPGKATTELAQAAAGFMDRHYGWQIRPSQVRPVADVLAALEYTITEFTRPGSAVVVPTPAYMPFLTLPKYLGREIIEVPMIRRADGAWAHDLDAIEAALAGSGDGAEDGAGLVLLCNPHNPLGQVFDRAELTGLAELVARFDARIFADEIHAPIRYSGVQHIPFASISEQAAQISVTATSTSKAFNTPGLKCGQIILTADADRQRWREMGWFGEHGTGTLGAVAAAAAYRDGDEWLAQFNSALESNRDLLVELVAEHLPDAKFDPPSGTYLAWVDLRAYRHIAERESARNAASSSADAGSNAAKEEFPRWDAILREHADIAIVDGHDCGAAGAGHIRINFATSPEVLTAALTRLGSFLHP